MSPELDSLIDARKIIRDLRTGYYYAECPSGLFPAIKLHQVEQYIESRIREYFAPEPEPYDIPF